MLLLAAGHILKITFVIFENGHLTNRNLIWHVQSISSGSAKLGLYGFHKAVLIFVVL